MGGVAATGQGAGTESDLTPEVAAALAQRQAEALAALVEALAALDRFVALYPFVSSSQAMMVRGMVGALRGMAGTSSGADPVSADPPQQLEMEEIRCENQPAISSCAGQTRPDTCILG